MIHYAFEVELFSHAGDVNMKTVKEKKNQSSWRILFASAGMICATTLNADTLAFWEFKDGSPGDYVTAIQSTSGKNTYSGEAGVADQSNGKYPMYSSDGPGRLAVSSRDLTILSENPGSIDFRYAERSTHQGGYIDLSGVADDIVGKGDFTIECFIKMDENYVYWQEGDGQYDQISKTMLYLEAEKNSGGFKLVAPIEVFKDGTSVGKAKGFALQTYNRGELTKSETRGDWNVVGNDGRWRHFAIVYSETNKTAKVGALSFYMDYKKVWGSPVPYANTDGGTGLKFRIGSGYKDAGGVDKNDTESVNGSISALRVSDAALDVVDFETPISDVLFAIPFNEGTNGAKVVNATVVSDPDRATECKYHIHSGTTDPTYEAQGRIGRKVLWDGEAMWENLACCHFRGWSSLPEGADLRVYAGYEMRVWDETGVRMNPPSWTMEAFVKVEYEQEWETGVGSLLFGKNGNASPHSNPKVWPQYAWMLTRTGNGHLRISWTEVDDDPDYAYGDVAVSGDHYKSETTASPYLNDHRWHHVALSYDKPSRTFRLYVDYVCVLEKQIDRDLFDGPYPYYFSRMEYSSGFEGWMDEIRFSSVVRTPESFQTFSKVATVIVIR